MVSLEDFPLRLSKLRMQKGVTARDMSLSLGQNPGYINNIERGKALPTMANFYYICEYLGIEPAEFFLDENPNPTQISRIEEYLKLLSDSQLEHIEGIAHDLADSNRK